MDGDVCEYYDEGTQYWYDSEGVLVMTYDDNGDWWMLNIANGTQCYYYADEEQAICYSKQGEYLHYYTVAQADIANAFK